MGTLPKNDNPVSIYSSSSCSKPVGLGAILSSVEVLQEKESCTCLEQHEGAINDDRIVIFG